MVSSKFNSLLTYYSKKPITPLAQLNKHTKFARVVARVIRSWYSSNPVTGDVWERRFVLCDYQGMAIEGKMLLGDYKRVENSLVEGNICEFEQFIVNNCPSKYKTVPHKFSLKFTRDTSIKVIDNYPKEIPFCYFEFVPFEEIGTPITADTEVFDIIGRLVTIDPIMTIQTTCGSIHIKVIHLVNERDLPVRITIWEEFLNVLPLETLAEQLNKDLIILAFNSLRLDSHKGQRALRTYSGTQMHFNQDLPYITDFLARYLQGRQTVKIAELLKYDGNNNIDKIFQCVATISRVNNPNSWCTYGCFSCGKILRKDHTSQRYWCDKCSRFVEKTVSCYDLALQVFDDTAEAQFFCFERNAELIVREPAYCVRYEPNPEPAFAPPSIRSVIGKEMVFTVKFDFLMLKQGQVSFNVMSLKAVAPYPDVPNLPAPAAPPLPVHETTLPLPKGDIAESSEHRSDKGKRKVEDSFLVPRQYEEEHESNHLQTPPRKRLSMSTQITKEESGV